MIKFDEFYYGSFDGSQEQRGVIDISYNLTAGQQKGGTPSINVLISGVSPLALLNAVKLNYVKAFGKCEQDGTPTPTSPVDIVCNNGVLKYSRNKINVIADNVVVGKYISAQGVLSDSEFNFTYMLYVPVKPNTTYTLSFSSPVYFSSVSEYSSAEDAGFVIRQTKQSTSLNEPFDLTEFTFTTGATTNYVRFGLNMYRLQSLTIDDVLALNYMLAESATAVPYAPYVNDNGGIYYDGTVETVTVKPNERENHFVQYINAYLRTSTRSITAYSGNSVVTFDCEVGKTYCCINRAMGGNSTSVNVGYSDTIPTTGYVYSESDFEATIIVDGDYKTTGLVFTAKKRYVTFIFRYDNDSSKTPTSMLEQMIFYETTKAQSATCQPLLSVGTYKDMQNITNGAITRNVGIKVLDGVTTGAKATSVNINTGKYYAVCGGQTNITATTTDLLSTHFKAGAFASGYDIVYSIATNIVLVNSNQSLTTVDSYNQWLASQYAAGTPVIIVYPLANPTTETVTGQTLTIAQGTNIVTATGSVDDLELEISYKGYAELTVEEIEAVNTDESVDVTIS